MTEANAPEQPAGQATIGQATIAPATAAPDPDAAGKVAAASLAEAEKAGDAAKAAAAKAEHDAKIASLATVAHTVLNKLDDLKGHLVASLGRAVNDVRHAHSTEAFLRDVELKTDEVVAWIKRTI